MANGANPVWSRALLSARLMKTCVVRVFGPADANATVPRVLWTITGSSGIVALCQAVDTWGYGLIPNWTTNFGTTRKNLAPS